MSDTTQQYDGRLYTQPEVERLIAQARASELDWALSRLNTFGKETDSQALRRAIDELDDNIAVISQTLKDK